MNYYIQGDATKADQIKAAFKKLGYTCDDFSYDVETRIYFTQQRDGGIISTVSYLMIDVFKTHPDYKELELQVEPKFKVGDEIAWIEAKGSKHTEPVKIIRLIDKDQLYMVDMPNGVSYVAYDMQDYYKLVQKPHYDVANFKPFDKVLTRDTEHGNWNVNLFSYYIDDKDKRVTARFRCINSLWKQCIPFEGNENLLGTTDMCDEMYINW